MSTGLQHPHEGRALKTAGTLVSEAHAAVILLHGRGASADDILALSRELRGDHIVYLAPQAAGNTWYPYSFLSPMERNEPFLSSALAVVDELFVMLQNHGISADRTILLGFSQGACLALEYAARHPRRYGGIAGLSGGLIGPEISPHSYQGHLEQTPVFLGCSDVDPHIPAARVLESETVFRRLGADVNRRLYSNPGHAVNEDEIAAVQRMLAALAVSVL